MNNTASSAIKSSVEYITIIIIIIIIIKLPGSVC